MSHLVRIAHDPESHAYADQRPDREERPMSTHDTLLRPAARRHAEALAAAAATEERVTALTDRLADEEFHRSVAEYEADQMRARVDLGDHQIIRATDNPPAHEITALLDISDGRAWVRAMRNGAPDGDMWINAASSTRGQMRYEWPFEGGPFIALPYEWELSRINRAVRELEEERDAAHAAMRPCAGYHDPAGSRWARPAVADAFNRIYAEWSRRSSEQGQRLQEAIDAKAALERKVSELTAQIEPFRPEESTP